MGNIRVSVLVQENFRTIGLDSGFNILSTAFMIEAFSHAV
jgi:hypothetical protein